MQQLTKIDRLSLPDHPHLRVEDNCFFLGEYTARAGFAYSKTNNLFLNFKKPVTRAGSSEWKYKHEAIEQIAGMLLGALSREWLQSATLVPMPPSKARNDPLYDDRMVQVLKLLGQDLSLDIRELILQRDSTPESHMSSNRPSRQDLIDNYVIDESVTDPGPTKIALFDDVLTTGAHYKAAQAVFEERFPGVLLGAYS